ncbi:MAG TPA: Rieske 2Fe-2S domain-containing protein [Reyranella sp.]|nr:Rieske 2Fe-2S domain-containing protein [Reyranella sp.]
MAFWQALLYTKFMKSEDYCQGDAFQAEKRTVFSAGWLPLGAEGQIAKPGDYLSVSVGGWGVVAVRGQDGTVRVLRNACRHQNMPVVNAGTGSCTNFRCRFHGWTYDLAGRFLSAPPPMAPPPTQTDRDLATFAATANGGVLFFSVGQAAAAAPQLGVGASYAGTSILDIDANWKAVVEHLLAEKKEFHWPLLFVRRDGANTVVHQIVPHTFLRTRLFSHVFGAGDGDGAAIKQGSESLQAARAAGTLPEESEFHIGLKRFMQGGSSSPS